MKREYLYLVRSKNNDKFKIGYTINPRSRAKNYQTHSLDVEFIGYKEIPDKKYEKLCHYELLKRQYKKCVTQGKTEWFEGHINLKEFLDLIQSVING
ncbi:MAG: T5orf172 domain protein [candidate division CPR1 bacterium ADurb.Bin160]|uniref:T5orf172 domain protein n=1 Tax=candidate division CPR1 bacterium ADurb.Bin160 TaxID=1852826 RepID=A0A1V5ZLB2_9BACT|nr:MAG: T5orf172 domain protein [candidate division CPR1 bacterium ADurb.Bin160]